MAEPRHIKGIYQEMKAKSTKKIIRVFPKKTNATPVDADVRINTFPGLFDQADEVQLVRKEFVATKMKEFA